MTQLEQLKSLLDEFGILHTVRPASPLELTHAQEKYLKGRKPIPDITDGCVLETESGLGYAGFSAVYYFDKDGNFAAYGVWE